MKKYLVFTVVALVSIFASAEPRLKGKIYEASSPRTEALFDFQNDFEKKTDQRISTSVFTRNDGAVAAVEVTKFDGDGRLKHYAFEDKQEKYSGTIELANGKAKFSYTKDGKTKTSEEDAGDDFIVGSMIPEDLQANWKKIMAGEKLKRRLAVVERIETIGFEFSKESETELAGQKAVVIKMRPSNFLISALVKPLRFYVKADGSTLMELHGRTLIKRQVGSSFKDLDAVTVYTQLAGGNSK